MSCDYLRSFTPLVERYQGFMLDQWGVLHNGVQVYPGVLELLHSLRDAGKSVVLLSNSGKRAASNAERLLSMGIDKGLYQAIVTSGEVAWVGLQQRRDALFADLGKRCYFVARGGDRSAIDGLDLQPTTGAGDADFVLLAGTDSSAAASDSIAAELQVARRLGLPVVCSNPDFTSVEPGSEQGKTPGTLALEYQQEGGEVRWVGKPWPAVYRAALAELDLPVAQILAVGDSLHHDIKGAAGMHIDAALISAGVHAESFALSAGNDNNAAQIAALTSLLANDPELASPRWLLPAFSHGS